MRLKQYASVLFITLICSLALFLRLYRFDQTIRFKGDQGMDMLIIREMEKNGHRPLVGPFLSLPDFYTPPTYYYLTWALYRMTGSIEGIVLGYVTANMIAMLALMMLAWDMRGRSAAWITGIFFAVSWIMIDHARQFWQPYLVQPLLCVSLLCLWHAHTRRKEALLYAGIFLFAAAFSVYPSPALLLPWIIYQIIVWYGVHRSALRITFVFTHALAIILVILPVFLPQILFEFKNGFPTLTSNFSNHLPSFSASVIIDTLAQNLRYIVTHVFPIFYDFVSPLAPLLAITVLIAVWLLGWNMLQTGVRSFIRPEIMASGLGFFLLYRGDIEPHRTWGYMPILILYTGICIDALIRTGGRRMLISIILAVIIIGSNLYHYPRYASGTMRPYMPPEAAIQANTVNFADDFKETRMISKAIVTDMRSLGIPTAETGVFHVVPNDPNYTFYNIYRLLYWLVEYGALTLTLTADGNLHTFDFSSPPLARHVYLTCAYFKSADVAYSTCVPPVYTNNGYASKRIFSYDWSVLMRLDAPENLQADTRVR